MARLFRRDRSGVLFELIVISAVVGGGLMTVWEMDHESGPQIGVVERRIEIPVGKGGHVDGVRVSVGGGDIVTVVGDRAVGHLMCVEIKRGMVTGFTTAKAVSPDRCLFLEQR